MHPRAVPDGYYCYYHYYWQHYKIYRLVQNVQKCGLGRPDGHLWLQPRPMILVSIAPLASHTTLCLWGPVGHFHIRAPTDFVPTPLTGRSPLFFTHCAPQAYVNNVRHYLAPHCGGQAYTQSYRTTHPDLCHHTNLSTVTLLLRLLRCVSLGNGERGNGSVAPPSWMRYRWPTSVGCPTKFDRYTSNGTIRHIWDLQ